MILQKNKWPCTENAVRYRIFAELVVELVHFGSWASYKCHTLSTVIKLRETTQICKKIISRTIGKGSINPIISEVNDALKNDIIVR